MNPFQYFCAWLGSQLIIWSGYPYIVYYTSNEETVDCVVFSKSEFHLKLHMSEEE